MTTLIEDNASQLYIFHGDTAWGGRELCDPGTGFLDLQLVEAGKDLLGNLPMWRDGAYYPQGVETQGCEVESDTPSPVSIEVGGRADIALVAEIYRGTFSVYIFAAGHAARCYLGIEARVVDGVFTHEEAAR